MPRSPLVLCGLILGMLSLSPSATAQPLGAFRWQLPLLQRPGAQHHPAERRLRARRTDDRCGAAQAAGARGIAFLNPDGTIGLGVAMVQPGGVPVHLEAASDLPSLNGTWRDSTGASGTFVSTPGPGIGGPPRQVAASGLPPASITSAQLANGAVGALAIAPNSITSGHVADGNITGLDLASGAVGPATIAASAISGGHIADGSITSADLLDEPKAVSSETVLDTVLTIGSTATICQVTITAPVPGRVIVNVSGWIAMESSASFDSATCSITTLVALEVPYAVRVVERAPGDYLIIPFGGTRAFSVPAGPTTFRFLCQGSGARVWDASMTAMFFAGS